MSTRIELNDPISASPNLRSEQNHLLDEKVSRVAEELNAPCEKTPSASLTEKKIAHMPNLAYEILIVGLMTEKKYQSEIQSHIREASDMQDSMDLLIKASGKLSLYTKDVKEVSLSEEVRSLCAKLKDRGIEILQDGEENVSLERLAEIKGQLSAQTDQLKTKLQTLFTTQIQVKINELSSILECLKTIFKLSDRLISSIINHQSR